MEQVYPLVMLDPLPSLHPQELLLLTTLCVPSIKKKTSSQFIASQSLTKCLLNFLFLFHCEGFDYGEQCMHGDYIDGIYSLPTPSTTKLVPATLLAGTWVSLTLCHSLLEHPFSKTVQHLLHKKSLPLSSKKFGNPCISYTISKAHKIPFFTTLLSSKHPLEYIYANVWGPTLIVDNNDFKYCVIC